MVRQPCRRPRQRRLAHLREQQQVAGQASFPDLEEHAVDLRARRLGGQCRLRAGDLGVHPQKVAGDVLGVAVGRGVHRAELTNPEGRARHADTGHPGVSVRRVPGAELVGAPHPVERRVGLDVVEQGEGEVARDAERPLRTQLGDGVARWLVPGV